MNITLTAADQLALFIIWLCQSTGFFVIYHNKVRRVLLLEDRMAQAKEQATSKFKRTERLCQTCDGEGQVEDNEACWVCCDRCAGEGTLWVRTPSISTEAVKDTIKRVASYGDHISDQVLGTPNPHLDYGSRGGCEGTIWAWNKGEPIDICTASSQGTFYANLPKAVDEAEHLVEEMKQWTQRNEPRSQS